MSAAPLPRASRALAWITACLLGFACARGLPERLDDCADAACQQRWALERWPKDPDAVIAALRDMNDPLAVTALARALTTAFPGETVRLCDALPPGPAQLDCRGRNQRPHLQELSVPPDGEVAVDPEESLHKLAPSGPFSSPWADLPADTTCPAEGRVCQTDAARAHASAGDSAAAAAACNAVLNPTWRAECYFQAAESGVSRGGAEGGAAVGLCLGASSFVGRCLTHVVRALGTAAPRAGAVDAAGWTRLIASVDAATASLAPVDPSLAESFRGQAWTYALRFSYAQDLTLTLAPLDLLPAEAAPHVRGAAAWRVWGLESGQSRDLAAWEARLAELMANRAPTPRPTRAPDVRTANRWKDLWRTTYQGEDALPRTFFLGAVYRATSADEAEDMLICLLEAAARGQPPGRELLNAALHAPRPLVRWTAARLLQGVDPASAATLSLPSETDPLVLARVKRQR